MAQEANSLGLAMLARHAAPLEAALERMEGEERLAPVVLENDLYRRAPRSRVDAALDRLQHLLVIDHQETATAKKADLVLPAASFAEGDGTLVNMEGRAQRFFQSMLPPSTTPISRCARAGAGWMPCKGASNRVRFAGTPSTM